MGIGGADMPVLISFLNAGSGLAAAFCGVTIQNRFLIACGAMVGASGLVLTHAMCKAMNRSILRVLFPMQVSGALPKELSKNGLAENDLSANSAQEDELQEQKAKGEDLQSPHAEESPAWERAIASARNAQKVIVVPGYGMALAQAQFEVVRLAKRLEELGKEVLFAVHPVAGRMPGHMNVLLAEAEVDYTRLHQMEEINDQFKEADLALIVGACDVVNPAAIEVEGTPISGMPILLAHEANEVIVCNLDDKPGYSGVDNPLYSQRKTILLWGDAKESVQRLLEGLA